MEGGWVTLDLHWTFCLGNPELLDHKAQPVRWTTRKTKGIVSGHLKDQGVLHLQASFVVE